MAQKTAEKVVAGTVPAADDPTKVRNVVLVGRSGAGKTTLAEALLAVTGTISRAGKVVDGTTVCDHDPSAVKQQRSVSLSVASFAHEGIKVNLLDTPGYADFVGEVRAGLRAADAALFVVPATDGAGEEDTDIDSGQDSGQVIGAATVALWEECAAVGMPRAVVITRLDHPRADFTRAVAACQTAFGAGVVPLYLPVPPLAESTEQLVGLLTERIMDYSAGAFPPVIAQPEPAHRPMLSPARAELIEAIIAESEDETLMDAYLGGETLDVDNLIFDLETAVARGSFYPAIPACGVTGVGLAEVLEVVTRGFPSPAEHELPLVTGLDGRRHSPLKVDPDGPLVAEVVKTTVDPYVGRVSLVRVFSGTLRAEQTIHVSGHGMAERGHADHDVDERAAHLFSALGAALREIPYCVAGDLCALTKIDSAETGDTVSAKNEPLLIAPWEMPEPLLPVAVVAKTRSDEDALAKNLGRLAAGDPTLRLERNPETGQLVLWCMGEAHAEVVLDRLRAGGADLDTEPVRVSLRETFVRTTKGHGRHVKQSGGHGQFGVCDIEVDPLERGAGFEFVDKVVGGAVPHNYIPSVDKGVRAQMERGLVAGFPVVDIRVRLVDGKAHSVDSSDAAFQTAGALALRDAAATGEVMLLEPVDVIAIRVPDALVGTVMVDLSGRRGRVLGTEPAPARRTLIHAEVPAVELSRYVIDLRSLTSGSASFTRRFARFEQMPPHLAAQHRSL